MGGMRVLWTPSTRGASRTDELVTIRMAARASSIEGGRRNVVDLALAVPYDLSENRR
jgi:hypothetical protein